MELDGSISYSISLFHNDNKQYDECYVPKDALCFELSKSKFGCFVLYRNLLRSGLRVIWDRVMS